MDAPFPTAEPPDSEAVPSTPKPLKEGQEIFGRFTLLEQIGRGRCSVVWRADDPRFGREVALKIFQSADPSSIAAEQNAWRELLRRIRGLNSPHIAAPLEFLNEKPWIALCNPLVNGETLAQHLKKPGKPWSVSEKENTLKAIGTCLADAHEKARIIHGNLNPFNILIKSAGDPRVTDFGFHLPLSFEPGDEDSAWKMATASPERKAGAGPSQPDDLYAFAVIAYQILTGGNPPTVSGEIDLRSVGTALDKVAGKWSQPLQSALAPDPAARPTSIRALLGDVGLLPPPPAGVDPLNPPKPRRKHHTSSEKTWLSRWGFLILCVLCGIALAVGIGWIIRQSSLENEKLVAERTAEEEIARSVRLAAAKNKPPAAETPAPAPLGNTAASRAQSALPTATPIKINTGALDFLREGQAKFKAGNATGALESYDLALILQTDWPELLEARGQAKAAGDLPEDAIDEYTAALQVEPARISALLGRAGVYVTLGRYQNAQADFEAVLAADPQNAPAKAGLAQIADLKAGK